MEAVHHQPDDYEKYYKKHACKQDYLQGVSEVALGLVIKFVVLRAACAIVWGDAAGLAAISTDRAHRTHLGSPILAPQTHTATLAGETSSTAGETDAFSVGRGQFVKVVSFFAQRAFIVLITYRAGSFVALSADRSETSHHQN